MTSSQPDRLPATRQQPPQSIFTIVQKMDFNANRKIQGQAFRAPGPAAGPVRILFRK
jgi:hypothetical protein